MTPQEFFKNDLFAEKAGIVLMEVREGYSKARLEIKKEHLNAATVRKEGPSSHLPTSPWQLLPIHMGNLLSLCPPISHSYAPVVKVTHSTPKPANATSDEAPDTIR